MTDLRHVVLVLCVLIVAGCGSQYADDPAQREIAPNRRVWVAIRPTNCSDADPWRKDWIESHNGDTSYPRGADEMPAILDFCSKRGIRVVDSLYRYDSGNDVPCGVCTCPSGYTAYLLVDQADAPALASFGFSPKHP